MSEILVIGESLVDVVVRPDGSSSEHPGGSPMNVAIGLARLGRQANLLTRIGEDERGRSVLAHLAASGVHVVEGSVRPTSTSIAAATLAADGSASYSFDLQWTLPDHYGPDAGLLGGRLHGASEPPLAVHTGSIAAVLEPGATAVARAVLAHLHRSTITYDPNLRPDLMGTPDAVRLSVESLVAASDVVKLSDEDAAWLEPETPPEDLAQRWLALGPAVVVLTGGAEGVTAWARCGRVTIPALTVEVADTVGAGDSAMAALLDALADHGLLGGSARERLADIDTDTLTAVLLRAVQAAAITVSRPGADPPSRAELDAASAGRVQPA